VWNRGGVSSESSGCVVRAVTGADAAVVGQDRGAVTRLTRTPGNDEIALTADPGPAFVLDRQDSWFVLPASSTDPEVTGSLVAWLLPVDADGSIGAVRIEAPGPIVVRTGSKSNQVSVNADHATVTVYGPRPHTDVFGAGYRFDFAGGDALADAWAAFSWGTLLPSVVERTRAVGYSESDGYVVSTLEPGAYAGTYPDVDHEFQMKGRIAAGDRLSRDVVGRMIDLQLLLMREDPDGLWRDPCAIQPDGVREYHVRRSSLDGSNEATMFLVTGNVEIIESAWLFAAAGAPADWLPRRIADLESALGFVESLIDSGSLLWSDVYYEDQVIKDGRETMATALAARSFGLLADLEDALGRSPQASRLRGIERTLAEAMCDALPHGHWDATAHRFVDWVDRAGEVHDHLHLLANTLPVTLGYTDATQAQSVARLVEENVAEFQRFPTFMSADIAAYTPAEIGDGGPYDLCAAGRYWCWDAAYWAGLARGDVIAGQLDTVARQAKLEGWVMGERYDMRHVYYADDGRDWHGAAHYYEYPCVFGWVLVQHYLGVQPWLESDLRIAPLVGAASGSPTGYVELSASGHAVAYRWDEAEFTLYNLAETERTFTVDLSASIGQARTAERVALAGGASTTFTL
jgi:hypothetical protein